VGIPPSNYKSILCQLKDDPSLVLIEENEKGAAAKIFAFEDFPSDKVDPIPLFPDSEFVAAGISSSRDHLLLIYSPGIVKVIPNEVISMTMTAKEEKLETNIVDTSYMAVSVNPSLEYAQMFKDAWRLLRDYFYDTNMNGIDWREMLDRYKDLVKRCSKREELDDILAQMASELSALHVFVYGGEYNDPVREDDAMKKINEVPCLGATFERSVEFKGYIVTSIAHRDPDFNLNDGRSIYSPLSSQSLELSGQRGLEVGDVVVGINGESVMRVPDMHMLLRGTAGRSVRFDVIRQPEARRLDEFPGNSTSSGVLKPEPIIAVPLPQKDGENLRYAAWEWNTRQKAKEMARDRGFSLGYVHLRSMEGPSDVDAFMRGFFPDYNKDALIIDVRHNRGGNIDSWYVQESLKAVNPHLDSNEFRFFFRLLDILQRKAWMFWQDRATNIYNGGLGWDEQFAFRGHLVVLVDEKTSSDGEGFARGVSELGLGRLVGTRTWGGG
jgi:tricorn protease